MTYFTLTTLVASVCIFTVINETKAGNHGCGRFKSGEDDEEPPRDSKKESPKDSQILSIADLQMWEEQGLVENETWEEQGPVENETEEEKRIDEVNMEQEQNERNNVLKRARILNLMFDAAKEVNEEKKKNEAAEKELQKERLKGLFEIQEETEENEEPSGLKRKDRSSTTKSKWTNPEASSSSSSS